MYPITLTSDFGLQNHYVASAKAKILFQIKDANIIDISHQIMPFNLQQAAYIFKSCYTLFPKGTIHFILNDLHPKNKKKLLYVYENGQHIFCADNGFITLLFSDKPVQLFVLKDIINNYNYLQVVEVFVTNALEIIHGEKIDVQSVSADEIMIKRPTSAFETNNVLELQMLYIDNFGNVILNIQKAQFEEYAQGRQFKILFMRDEEIHTISNTYNDVGINEKLCLFNTAGYLEIAINKGNAATLFGFKNATEKNLFYAKIKIFFE